MIAWSLVKVRFGRWLSCLVMWTTVKLVGTTIEMNGEMNKTTWRC